MDFNVKKLVNDAGTVLSRVVQVNYNLNKSSDILDFTKTKVEEWYVIKFSCLP